MQSIFIKEMKIVNIYTDGACSSNKVGQGIGGWAVVIENEKLITKSGYEHNTTNNRMELLAVVKVLQHLSKQDVEYKIFSDSAYVCNAINECWIDKWMMSNWKTSKDKDVLNQDLWLQVIQARKRLREKKIKWSINKVKGHSSIECNELADKVAKQEVIKAKSKIYNK